MAGPQKPRNAFAEPEAEEPRKRPGFGANRSGMQPTVFERTVQNAGLGVEGLIRQLYSTSPRGRADRAMLQRMERLRDLTPEEQAHNRRVMEYRLKNLRPMPNALPRTPEAIEAERQADELLRLKKERRNAFAPKG